MNSNRLAEKDKLFFITKTGSTSTHRARRWLKENEVEYIEIDTKDLTYNELEYIIEVTKLDVPNEQLVWVEDLVQIDSRIDRFGIQKELIKDGIELFDVREHQLLETFLSHPKLLRAPILIKNGIAVFSAGSEELSQFLCGEKRKEWVKEQYALHTARERIEWIAKNFEPPKVGYTNATEVYLPNTSYLFGGEIKWDYDESYFSGDHNLLIKEGIIKIGMSIELDGESLSREFTLHSKLNY